MRDRKLFVRFTKIDEEKREAAGRMTQEIVDRDGEIWDYDASVPHVKAWSDSFDKATDGKSLGNVRAMHQPISAGKLTGIDFNDGEKAVDIVAKIVDDAEWDKVKEGVYTGFSIGGNVVRSWRDPSDLKHKRFEVKPNEVSLADYPCVPTATFSYVKVGGATEERRFTKVITASAGASLAYADTANQKLPLFNKTMTRAAMALWGQPATRAAYSEREQDAIGRAIRTAASGFGIADVTEKAMRRGDYAKGLYEVGRLAELVQSLAWMQQNARYERDSEADDSTVPDMLADQIAALLGTLETMLGEEGDELLATLGHSSATTKATEDSTVSDKNTDSGDFVKVSKANIAKLKDMHSHLTAVHKMMGEGCDKIAGFIDEVGGESTTKIAASGDVEKVAKSDYEKVVAERADFEKRLTEVNEKLVATETERDEFKKNAEELAELGEKLTAAVEVRKGTLRAVERANDGAPAEKVEKVVAATPAAAVPAGQVDRGALHSSFRKAFKSPQVETGMPGQ